MFDVITVGSGTVDVFVETEDRLFRKTNIHKENICAVPFGSKVLVEDIRYDIGGGGTNCGVAFKRLGLDVAWLGKIGDDANSQKIIDTIKKEGVNTKLLCKGDKGAGYSIILDAAGHDRTILAYKGSNNDLLYEDINFKKLKTRWLYFSSMMKDSYETSKKLAEYAVNNGIKIAFNPSSYLVKKGKRYLAPLLEKTDILIFNKEEAGILVGDGPIGKLLIDVKKLVPGLVVITDGKNGAWCYDGGLTYRVFAHKIKVLESTGAGDAFAASFVSAIIKGKEIQTALKWGIANSQSVIAHYGAKNKLLTYRELLAELRKNPVDVKARL